MRPDPLYSGLPMLLGKQHRDRSQLLAAARSGGTKQATPAQVEKEKADSRLAVLLPGTK